VPWRLGAPWLLQRTPPFVSIKTLLLAVWPSFPWMDSASPTINSPMQQMNGSPQGSIWQTWPQYRRRLVASCWTMFSWMSSVVLMSMFRLWSFISDDSSNYSEAANFKHAQLSLSICCDCPSLCRLPLKIWKLTLTCTADLYPITGGGGISALPSARRLLNNRYQSAASIPLKLIPHFRSLHPLPSYTHTTLFTNAWQIQSIDISVRKENKLFSI